PHLERWGALALFALALLATPRILHESIAGGMMGMMYGFYAIPILTFALVAWAAASRGLADGPRRATLVGALLLPAAAFALIRTGGMTGGAASDWHWRWTRTREDRLLAQRDDEPAPPPPTAAPAPATL